MSPTCPSDHTVPINQINFEQQLRFKQCVSSVRTALVSQEKKTSVTDEQIVDSPFLSLGIFSSSFLFSLDLAPVEET